MSVTSLQRDYTTLLTEVNDPVWPGLIDQTHREVPYLYAMANLSRPMGGIMVEKEGVLLRFDIIHMNNSQTVAFEGWDTVSPAPIDPATAAFEGWSFNATPLAISMTDMLKAGTAGAERLATTCFQVSIMDHYTELHRQLVQGVVGTTGTQPTYRFQRQDAKQLLPLGYLIQKYPVATGIYANADVIHQKTQTVDTHWRNQIQLAAVSSFAGFLDEVRATKRACSRGSANDGPDLGLCSEMYYGLLEKAIDPRINYNQMGTAELEFDNIVFGGTRYIYDYQVPNFGDTVTDTVALPGTADRDACLYLNTNWIQIVVHEDAYCQPMPWQAAFGKFGVASAIITAASHRVTQRRKHGLHFGVAGTTTVA